MTCSSIVIDQMSELEFANGLRRRTDGACVGPLAVHSYTARHVSDIEDGLDCERMVQLLWAGFRPRQEPRLSFELCAGHWFDLAAVLYLHGERQEDSDLIDAGCGILYSTLFQLKWDIRELSNMVHTPRVAC